MKPAIIFDMDMTLFLTKKCIGLAARNYFLSHGFDISSINFCIFSGIRESSILKYCCKKAGITYDEHVNIAVMDEYVRLAPELVYVYEGVEELLNKLSDEGYDLALSTSSEIRKVYANFNAARLDISIFDAVITSEDVLRAKPCPDLFLLAAQELNRLPDECIVIEDSINGIKAAHNAGMECIVIAGNSFSKERLIEAKADFIVGNIFDAYYIINGMDV